MSIVSEHIFSFLLILLMFGAFVKYLVHGNYPMALYWVAVAILNIAVVWNSIR